MTEQEKQTHYEACWAELKKCLGEWMDDRTLDIMEDIEVVETCDDRELDYPFLWQNFKAYITDKAVLKLMADIESAMEMDFKEEKGGQTQ